MKYFVMPICKPNLLKVQHYRTSALFDSIKVLSLTNRTTTKLAHPIASGGKPVKVMHTIHDGPTKSKINSSPIIIQHGLLGSRKNWTSLAKAIHLKTGTRVVTSDARNHGDSPHTEEFNYERLSDDIELLMKDLGVPKATLVGHSMGGRAVMRLALTKPSLVDKLVVVDISPIKVSPGAISMAHYLKAMKEADLSSPSFSALRKSVDQQLESIVKEVAIRQFILTNLTQKDGQFSWKVNLDSIIKNLPHIVGSAPFREGVFHGPTLFVAGERSDYIRPHDEPAIQEMFPNSQFVYIPDAGHWVHSEKPADFLQSLYNFLGL